MKNLIDVPVHTINRNVHRNPNKIKTSMICVLAFFLCGAFETALAGDTLATNPTSNELGVNTQAENEVNFSLNSTTPIESTIQEVSIVESKQLIENIPSIHAPSTVSSGFGTRKHPISGKIKPHRGIDLPFPSGTPILAPANGLIIFSGWKNGFGNVIQIDHGNGYSTLFAHNSINLVHTGDYVTITTTIAKVGATGWATGPHIHLEVRFEGNLLNPLKFLRR